MTLVNQVVKITAVDRMRNTNNGNPVWCLSWDNGWAHTKPDASFAYDVSDELVGRTVKLMISPRVGHIVGMVNL